MQKLITEYIRLEVDQLKKCGFNMRELSEISGINHTKIWRVLNDCGTKLDLKTIEKLERARLINLNKYYQKTEVTNE